MYSKDVTKMENRISIIYKNFLLRQFLSHKMDILFMELQIKPLFYPMRLGKLCCMNNAKGRTKSRRR